MNPEKETKVKNIINAARPLQVITNLKRATNALNISELRYRRLFETSRDGIIILDAETGMIVDVNPFLIEMLGYTKKQFIKKKIWEIGLFKDIIANRDNFVNLQQKEYIKYEDLPLLTADGRQIEVEFVSNVHLVNKQRVIQCNIRDNTDHKQAEKKLRKDSEERFQILTQASINGFYVVDIKGHIIEVNDAYCTISGYSKDCLLSMYISDLECTESAEQIKAHIESIRINGWDRFESKHRRADGNIIDVQSNVTFIPDKGLFLCFINDITERRQAERDLFETRNYLEKLINQANAPIMEWDAKLRITRFNRAFEIITGRKADKVLGKTLEILFPPDKVSTYMLLFQNMQKGKGKNAVEIDIMHMDGSVRTILWNSTTIYGAEGLKPISIIAQGLDITDRLRAKDEILYNSYHDQLTGLYNRRFFEEELNRLDVERNLPISMVMCDVNGLKLVNDSFGHVMGDHLLQKVAEVLRKGCRADEFIARLGGDEFIIILPKTNESQTEEIIKHINHIITKEKVGSLTISISIGFETKKKTNEDMRIIFKNTEDHMYRHKLSESSSARSKIVSLILNTLFEKSNREMLHSKRVSEICVEIAARMNFDMDNINMIRTVGLMHDIGKIGIDEEILNTKKKLNAEERKEMERHCEIGYQILNSVSDFSEIAIYVLEHHEKWDGKGYPRGRKGEEISLPARIVAVADSYDAMTSTRTYKEVLSEVEAIGEIRRCAGTQFDPNIARVFIEKVLGKEW